jgi:hypothetical protein
MEIFAAYRGGSAGRVDATRGSKHRGLEHAGEKRKSEAQACSLRGDCTKQLAGANPRCVTPSSDFGRILN